MTFFMQPLRRLISILMLLILSFPLLGEIERVSVNSSGVEGNNRSNTPRLSVDGRYVAFVSFASNLVDGDTNKTADVFVYDREIGKTERVSVSSSGVEGNGGCFSPSLSADGRYVAFRSDASNLVDGDTNGIADVFVYDRDTRVTQRVSIDSSGREGKGIGGFAPDISADGRYVAFASSASNLVAEDTNRESDIFVHDRDTGVTERVSINSSGNEGNGRSTSPSINADGRFVTFRSSASNLVVTDTNRTWDIFRHDRSRGVTERVSVDSSGGEGNSESSDPSLSADGRYVVFRSNASNLVPNDSNGINDIFAHDSDTGSTELISVNSSGDPGNDISNSPSISADGRYIVFQSHARNLVSGDTNGNAGLFVRDRSTGVTDRVGNEGNSDSISHSLSADGSYVAFDSLASNLVAGDTNETFDIFVQNREASNPESTFSSSVVVNENTTAVLDIGGVDPAGNVSSYSITGGTDQSLFTINTVGQLSFLNAPDFEDPADSDVDNIYNVEVTGDHENGRETLYKITITVADDNPLKLTVKANKWVQIGIPCSPAPDEATVADLIGDDIPGVLGTDWGLFNYNIGGGYGSGLTLSDPMKAGVGYWLIHLNQTGAAVEIDLPESCSATPVTQPTGCASPNGCFEIPLETSNPGVGLNMLGHAFKNTTAWDRLRILDDNKCRSGCTPAAAEANDVFFNQGWHYNPELRGGAGAHETLSNGSLEQWDGFWVITLKDAVNPRLLIPVDNSVQLGERPIIVIETSTNPN